MLNRVELRSVRRQPLNVQARVGGLDGADGITFVVRAVIPDDNHFAAQMPQEFAKEVGGGRGVDVGVGISAEVQAELMGSRRQRQASDRGDLLPTTAWNAQDGRLPARRQSPADQRIEKDAALVDQYDVGLAFGPFFRMRGQSTATQRSMRA